MATKFVGLVWFFRHGLGYVEQHKMLPLFLVRVFAGVGGLVLKSSARLRDVISTIWWDKLLGQNPVWIASSVFGRSMYI